MNPNEKAILDQFKNGGVYFPTFQEANPEIRLETRSLYKDHRSYAAYIPIDLIRKSRRLDSETRETQTVNVIIDYRTNSVVFDLDGQITDSIKNNE